MLRIDAQQVGRLRQRAVGEWLCRSFAGSHQDASFDSASGDVRVTDPAGNTTRFVLDEHGFIGVIRSPLGRTWRFGNDPDGRPLRIDLPSGLQIVAEYDPAGQLTRVFRDSVQQFAFSFEGGELQQVGFPDRTTTHFEYSATGQLIALHDRLGHTERFERADDGDRITALEDGNGNRTTFRYGEWDRPDETIFPDGTSEFYGYDDNGYVSQLTAPDGTALQILNDSDGRILSITDGADESSAFEYDANGRVTRANNPQSAVSFDYDGDGRILQEVQGERTIDYRYDVAGALVGMRYPDGDWVEFGYDADMRLSVIRDWSGQSHEISYATDDQGYQIRLANGLVSSVRQTPSGLPGSISVLSGGRIRRELFSLNYEYDEEDRVRRLSDSEFGTCEYRYDAESRLLEVKALGDNSPRLNEKFEYDAAGNRTNNSNEKCTFDGLNRLTRQGASRFSYDGRGNLVTYNGWTLTYDSRNRLVEAQRDAGETVSFGYDAFGRRIWKRSSSGETRYVWAGEQMLTETKITAAAVESRDFLYFPGTSIPFALRTNGQICFFHTDHLGTPRRLSDSKSQIVWGADYSGYGHARVVAAKESQPFRFPGQYHDEETGLHYNRFRFYAPDLGRYLTRDPISVLAGLNVYEYSSNNPVNSADPSGLIGWKLAPSFAARTAVSAAVVKFAPDPPLIKNMSATEAAVFVAGASARMLCVPCIILRAAHYNRNVFNHSLPLTEAAAAKDDSGWVRAPADQNAFHRWGLGYEGTVKYKTADHKREAVYNNGKLVTDPTNMGTYNVGTSEVSHVILDIIPYLFWGNGRGDHTTAGQRFGMAGCAWRERGGPSWEKIGARLLPTSCPK